MLDLLHTKGACKKMMEVRKAEQRCALSQENADSMCAAVVIILGKTKTLKNPLRKKVSKVVVVVEPPPSLRPRPVVRVLSSEGSGIGIPI